VKGNAWPGRGRNFLLQKVNALRLVHRGKALDLRLTAMGVGLFHIHRLDWTTQAIGQQHTSPLRARCEARRREVVVIFGCGNGLARDAPEASKVDGGLRAGGPQGLQAKPGGGAPGPVRITGRELMTAAIPRKFSCMQPLEGVDLEGHVSIRDRGPHPWHRLASDPSSRLRPTSAGASVEKLGFSAG